MKVAFVETPGQRGYVPIAVAYLAATARADPELGPELEYHLELGAAAEPVDAAVQRIMEAGPPDVLALSCQGWSLARSDAIARAVAEQSAGTLVVYGGNHVSNAGEPFFAERPYAHVVVSGEGEHTFRDILRAWRRHGDRDALAGMAGAAVRRADGTVVSGPERPRIADLDAVASPYLDGVLDSYLHAGCTALIETNRGCPYSCSYCYWGEAIGTKVQQFSMERVEAEMRYLAARGVDAWYVCDANFGIFARDGELVDLMVRLREELGYPRTMHTNWAKHSTERIVAFCAKLNAAGIHSTYTLALQSATTEALQLAHRKNMKINRVSELAGLCRRYGVVPRGELIWGLPGESYAEFRESFEVLAPHTDALSVYPHYLLPNTEFSARQEELGLRAYKAEPDTDYALCVEHPLMPREAFFEGMRFIISNNILRVASGFFRLYPRVAKAALGVSYADSTESLGRWIVTSTHPMARRFQRFYRLPMTTYRLSLAEVWAAIQQDRDGFVDMLRRYVEDTFHVSRTADPDAVEVARAAFEFDALTFPEVLRGSGHREEIIYSEYDLLAVRHGECELPPAVPRTYRVRWPRGLADYPTNKWYFGLMSFAADVCDLSGQVPLAATPDGRSGS